MKYNVYYTDNFKREFKKLAKKHRSLKEDVSQLISSLEENPVQGNPLIKNCYKIRLAISSKGKGKSGGGRVITNVHIRNTNVYLLSIYDKSVQESISETRLKILLDLI